MLPILWKMMEEDGGMFVQIVVPFFKKQRKNKIKRKRRNQSKEKRKKNFYQEEKEKLEGR